MPHAIQVDAAVIGQKIDNARSRLESVLGRESDPEAQAIAKNLRQELSENDERGFLSVAFIGQYSAGKSTIISALTGRRDIEIDSDIATGQTSFYPWNGLHLVDTPGLWTKEREDHDEITYGAIRTSDLLVYCLTCELFDDVTSSNFKKLAWKMGFAGKMMVVINKMSDEDKERDELVSAYRESLDKAVDPHRFDEFSCAFIDAKEFCKGVDKDDADLLEESFFSTFVSKLNDFVEDRGILAKADTPCRIIVGAIDDAVEAFSRDTDEDDAYLFLMNKISRKLRNERTKLRQSVRDVALDVSASISDVGANLADALGKADDFASYTKAKEREVEELCREGAEKMGPLIEKTVKNIEEQVSEVLEGELAKEFVANIEAGASVGVDAPKSRDVFLRRKKQWETLQGVGTRVGRKVADMSKGANSASGAGVGLLRSGQVAGSQLHSMVYTIGKTLGHSFQPWQAVNIARQIGNVGRVAGPALAVIGIGLDIYNAIAEEERSNELAEARGQITGHFNAVALEAEAQMDAFLRKEVEPQVFDEIANDLEEARKKHQEELSSTDERIAQLVGIREDMTSLILEITTGQSA